MPSAAYCESDVELLQQFTRCRTIDGSTALEVAVVVSAPKHKLAFRWEPCCAWPARPRPEELAEAWKAALVNPRYFRICSCCNFRTNRGQMFDESICCFCAEKHGSDLP
jgi:hypothetical protein